jgi:TrmH family RNA methyltransferase
MDALHLARDLKTPQGRRAQGRFLIEGVRLVEDALDRGVLPVEAFVTPHLLESTPRGQQLAQRLRQQSLTLFEVNGRALALAADTESPAGVVVVAVLPEPARDLPLLPATGLQALLLDQVRDPGNTGGILRTAAAAGLSVVVSSEGTVDLWGPKVVRAGAGAHFRLDLYNGRPVGSLEAWLRAFAQVVVADGHARTSLYEIDWRPNTALVVSNEAHGSSGWLSRQQVTPACIPMLGESESLNVGAAAAIMLYEAQRSRLRRL